MPDFTFLNKAELSLIGAYHINKFNCPPAGTRYGERVVKHYELDYITWGEGYIITDGKNIEAKKGSLFFRTPGMVVEGVSPYHCYYIVFDLFKSPPEVPEGPWAESIVPADLPKVVNMEPDADVEALFRKIVDESIFQKDVSPFIARTCLMQILYLSYNQWMSKERFENMTKSLKSNYKRILKIKEFIRDNIHRRITLDELAELSGLSRYFFCRVFKAIVGDTPIEYLNQCRIGKAKKMLVDTEKSVKEILFECGFENESHFFKLFKKHVGVTPTAFGQRYKYWSNLY